jgi:hypothetical protein
MPERAKEFRQELLKGKDGKDGKDSKDNKD